jgi:acyl-CoA dehydrogenase
VVERACADCLRNIEDSLHAVSANLANRPIAWLIRLLALPLGRRLGGPPDKLDHAIAASIMQPGEVRDRLTASVYRPESERDRLRLMDAALAGVLEVEPLIKRLKKHIRVDALADDELEPKLGECVDAELLTGDEMARLLTAERLRREVIAVDAFGGARQTEVAATRQAVAE